MYWQILGAMLSAYLIRWMLAAFFQTYSSELLEIIEWIKRERVKIFIAGSVLVGINSLILYMIK